MRAGADSGGADLPRAFFDGWFAAAFDPDGDVGSGADEAAAEFDGADLVAHDLPHVLATAEAGGGADLSGIEIAVDYVQGV